MPSSLSIRSSFTWSLSWRIAVIFLFGAAAIWAAQGETAIATLFVLLLLIGLLLADLIKLIARTNLEMARLVSALRFGDFSQSFEPRSNDASFNDLGAELEALMADLRTQMTDLRADASQLASMIDHVPIPLLSIDGDEQVSLLNNAARRLFGAEHGQRLDDFSRYGRRFVDDLRRTSSSQVSVLQPENDAAIRVRLTQSQITRRGLPQRLMTLQTIQLELDESEMTIARDLTRVLTHELMNSLTPVTSLAQSAARLAAALPPSPVASEVQQSIGAVARRADGLMQFVARYREVTRMPNVQRSRVSLSELVHELQALFNAEWQTRSVTLVCTIAPPGIEAELDRQLIPQTLINLLRNAAQAAVNHAPTPTVALHIGTTLSGRLTIDVEDNGPGVPSNLREDIFLPFFTTKADGSGIGLCLAKQVVVAHGGAVRVETSRLGGARFRLVI